MLEDKDKNTFNSNKILPEIPTKTTKLFVDGQVGGGFAYTKDTFSTYLENNVNTYFLENQSEPFVYVSLASNNEYLQALKERARNYEGYESYYSLSDDISFDPDVSDSYTNILLRAEEILLAKYWTQDNDANTSISDYSLYKLDYTLYTSDPLRGQPYTNLSPKTVDIYIDGNSNPIEAKFYKSYPSRTFSSECPQNLTGKEQLEQCEFTEYYHYYLNIPLPDGNWLFIEEVVSDGDPKYILQSKDSYNLKTVDKEVAEKLDQELKNTELYKNE